MATLGRGGEGRGEERQIRVGVADQAGALCRTRAWIAIRCVYCCLILCFSLPGPCKRVVCIDFRGLLTNLMCLRATCFSCAFLRCSSSQACFITGIEFGTETQRFVPLAPTNVSMCRDSICPCV